MTNLKLNPLEKLIFISISLVGIYSIGNPYIKSGYTAFFIFLILGSGLSRKKMLGIFGSVIFFLIPSFLIQGRALDISFLLTMLAVIPCIYFFLLTTGVKEFYHLGRIFRLPKLFCELAILTFGYLNLMLKSYEEVRTAMTARGGFTSFKRIHRDIGMLFSSIFKKLYFSLGSRANAMHSRCYGDEILFYPVEYGITTRGGVVLALWSVLNIAVKVSVL